MTTMEAGTPRRISRYGPIEGLAPCWRWEASQMNPNGTAIHISPLPSAMAATSTRAAPTRPGPSSRQRGGRRRSRSGCAGVRWRCAPLPGLVVASRTLTQEDLTWSGSVLLPADDAIGALRELRTRDGGALQVWGSASLAAQLIEQDLVDEYLVMIEPILLGGGKRVFPDDGQARRLELVSATTAGTGVLVCRYRPADR